jgi:hypothetical protein
VWSEEVRARLEGKACRGCGAWLPLEGFRRDKNRPDGRRAQCRDCTSSRDSEWRNRCGNLDERRKVWSQLYRFRHAPILAARLSKYRQDRPQANRAHHLVSKAVSRGALVRPAQCEWCSTSSRRIEATHGDYSKPYEVIWLCTPCHRRRDRGEQC